MTTDQLDYEREMEALEAAFRAFIASEYNMSVESLETIEGKSFVARIQCGFEAGWYAGKDTRS